MFSQRFVTFGTLAALLLVLTFSPAAQEIYFQDDFEDPAVSEAKWEVITGEWWVQDGVYSQYSTADPWLVTMVASDQWNDEWVEYTIEFRVMPLSEGDHPVNVLFRVQDPVPLTWADRRGENTHMYRWIVNGWTNTESRPYIYRPGESEMLAQTECSLEVFVWHDIKLEITMNGFTGYVNDEEMFDVEHAEWTTGRVGLQAYNGELDIDDFVIYGPDSVKVEGWSLYD